MILGFSPWGRLCCGDRVL